jgi:hypothetical protein
MWLPPELAMQVGSYLDPNDLQVCTTQLCSTGAGFVATTFTNDTTTIRLHVLVACCRLSVGVDNVAQECIERIELFLARRGKVRTIILDVQLWDEHTSNRGVYSEFQRRLQQRSSFQLSQNQEVTVEWHVRAGSIALVEFLLKVLNEGARVSDSSAGGAIRQSLHTLNLWGTPVSDVSLLASCKSLHTLDLSYTQVSEVFALASCKSLHTLNLSVSKVRDVSALSSCQSLHTLKLRCTEVSDVSELASCQSLHTLSLMNSILSDVSALKSCQSLHKLDLSGTQVSDVSALASCQNLHKLALRETQVSDVSALASCQNLHKLDLSKTQVRNVSVLASCQNLNKLDLSETQVSDVSALSSCQSLRKLVGVEDMIGGTDVLRMISGRG